MCRMCSHVQIVFSCAECVGCAIYWMFEYIGCFHPIQNVLDGIWTSSTLQATAYCIWSVISSFSFLNRWSSSLGFCYHVPLNRDQSDWDWGIRLNDTPNAIGCNMIWLNLIQLQRAQTDVKWDPKIDVKRIWMPKYIYTQAALKTWKQECHFVQYSSCQIQTQTSTTKGFGQGPLYGSNFPEKTSVLSGFPAPPPFPSVPPSLSPLLFLSLAPSPIWSWSLWLLPTCHLIWKL